MVHLRRRPKRTYAGLGLFLSLLVIAGAGVAIWGGGPGDPEAPVVESPATAHPVELEQVLEQAPESASEARTPKARSRADAKRPGSRRL